jgi:putative resolvase
VAGHRERLARFGVGCRVAALAAQGGKLLVAGQAGVGGDLVRDMAVVFRSFCAGLYGRGPAKHRAERAVAAADRAEAA